MLSIRKIGVALLVAATSSVFVPLFATGPGPLSLFSNSRNNGASESQDGLPIGFQTGGESDPTDAASQLITSGSHQYWVNPLGTILPEVALIATPNGRVFGCVDYRCFKTDDGGASWQPIAFLPPNVGPLIVPEGDIAVAPNGDILSTWLSPDQGAVTTKAYVSKDNGVTWQYTPLHGPQGAPDRPWVMVSTASPAPSDPLDPNPYLAISEAGVGVKPVWASHDRGLTWLLPQLVLLPALTPTAAVPLAADPFINYVKPFGQGSTFFPTKFLALGGGVILDVVNRRWTDDFVDWFAVPNPSTWPSTNNFQYWDSSSDGKIYALQLHQVGGNWQISYKWFDGTWHDGAIAIPLTAKPNYIAGLSEVGEEALAVKTHGSGLMGIATRQGNQDVLIRVTNPASATPSFTKENLGNAVNARYDYPNLVFDGQGRAILSYDNRWVAYATTA